MLIEVLYRSSWLNWHCLVSYAIGDNFMLERLMYVFAIQFQFFWSFISHSHHLNATPWFLVLFLVWQVFAKVCIIWVTYFVPIVKITQLILVLNNLFFTCWAYICLYHWVEATELEGHFRCFNWSAICQFSNRWMCFSIQK